VAGGFGKITKMAQGAMDLHSGRSQVDFDWLAGRVLALGGEDDLAAQVRRANTAMEAEALARGNSLPLADDVAGAAREAGIAMLRGADVALDIVVVDRGGQVIGRAG
jgi:cobalt-precorrin-5B (C1)-methyltransferase